MAAKVVDKEALEKAIAEHIVKNGIGNWGVIRAQFPDVKDATFWRSVKKFKDSASQLAPEAKKVLKEVQRAKDHLPMSMAPGTVIEHGTKKVSANIDYLVQLEEAVRVADVLRDYSMSADGSKVRIPAFLRDSAKLRLDVVKSAVSAMSFLADVRRMETFFTAVMEEVGNVSPEAQRKIMDRLQALNREYGMTAAAFV